MFDTGDVGLLKVPRQKKEKDKEKKHHHVFDLFTSTHISCQCC